MEIARHTLRVVRARWAEALRPHVRDAAALDLVLLVSDGLYYNNALTAAAAAGPVPRGVGLDALVALVERATR